MDRIACVACGVSLVGIGFGTIGGIVLEALFFPEAFGACGYICVQAFRE